MVVIGRGDEHGVDLLADLVEHLPVVGEGLKLVGLVLLLFVGERLADHGEAFLAGIDDGDEVLAQHRFDVRHAASARADDDAAEFVAGIGGVEDVEARGGESASRQGGLLEETTTVQVHGSRE